MTLILSGTDGVSDIDGTAATPAIRGTDANTGIFFPAADTIAFAEGGTEAMRINSNGNLLVGTTTTTNNLRLAQNFASVVVGDGNKGGISATSYGGTTGHTVVDLQTSRGTTDGSMTKVENGDRVGALVFRGSDGSTFRDVALIASEMDGATGANDMPGRLVFSTTADGASSTTQRMVIDSSGNVGIGTSSPQTKLSAVGEISAQHSANDSILKFGNNGTLSTISATYGSTGAYTPIRFLTSDIERMRIDSSGNVGVGTTSPFGTAANRTCFSVNGTTDVSLNVGSGGTQRAYLYGSASVGQLGTIGALPLVFAPNDAERARITSDGGFAMIKTDPNSLTTNGFSVDVTSGNLNGVGICKNVGSWGTALWVNRLAAVGDGTLVEFATSGTSQGSISVSGATVSYNAFSGSHWSQFQQGRGYNPEILRGTVMSSIGEMCEWKSVVWDEVIEHPAVPAVEAKEAVLDEEGNVIEPAVEAVEGKDAWTETIQHRKSYLGELPIGATFEEDGVTKTVVDDGNERLPKVKISDVVGDKAVYGVFQTYDDVQDMLVTSLGAFVVRIAANVTVQIGDLLESNGDGCAKVQDDDVIRSKTIGKVTSTTPSATYADGSYTVPAVLYCG